MAERQHTPSPARRDQITTTEGVRAMPAAHEAHAAHDEPHPPATDLTIIEPEPPTTAPTEGVETVTAILTALQEISTLSLALPSSEYLAHLMVSVQSALQQAETLKLHLQGVEV